MPNIIFYSSFYNRKSFCDFYEGKKKKIVEYSCTILVVEGVCGAKWLTHKKKIENDVCVRRLWLNSKN